MLLEIFEFSWAWHSDVRTWPLLLKVPTGKYSFCQLQAHLVLLHFALLHLPDKFFFLSFFFYKLKICGNPALSKSMGGIFPTAFAHFLSLCHISVTLTIFQTFSWLLVCYGDLWSVIFDVTAVIVLGSHEPCPYKTVNFVNKSVCSDCSTDWFFPLSCSLFSGLLILWESIVNNIGIRPINNPTVTSICLSEKKN